MQSIEFLERRHGKSYKCRCLVSQSTSKARKNRSHPTCFSEPKRNHGDEVRFRHAIALSKFETPVPIDSPQTLSKLAQATSRTLTLALTLLDGKLSIGGIADFSQYTNVKDDRSFHMGLALFVRNPGVIEYCEGDYVVAFVRGVVKHYRVIWRVSALRQLASEVTAANREKLLRQKVLSSQYIELGTVSGWDCIVTAIKSVVARGHGGMLAVTDKESSGIEIRYRTNTNSTAWTINEIALSYRVIDMILSKIGNELTLQPEKFIENLLTFWGKPRVCDTHMRLIEGIGDLAGVDGCVVLNRQFDVLGFGAIVTPDSNENFKTAKLPVVNEKGMALDRVSILKNRGTRHRAAIRLCDMNEYCVVFVVSQDGDIRLFVREAEQIVFVDNVAIE